MEKLDWLNILGWNETQMQDIRTMGYLYLQQGKYDIALQFFEALGALNKNVPFDLQTLGALYLQMGDNLSALNYLEQALTLDPACPITKLNKAKALFLLGYSRQAVMQAQDLTKHQKQAVANQAKALLLAYQSNA